MVSFVLLVVLCLLFVETTLAILLGALLYCNIGVIYRILDLTFVLPPRCQFLSITASVIVDCKTFFGSGSLLGEAFLSNPLGRTVTFRSFQFRIEVALFFAWIPNLGSGAGFVEATNRGSSSRKALPNFVNFCIANPTYIAKIKDILVSLCQQNFFWTTVSLVVAWRPFLGAGFRFGEALNPGPARRRSKPELIRFCITNPTSIAKKEDSYVNLIKAKTCHLVSLSETAATEIMQNHFTASMRKHQMQCQWSTPVQPFRNTITSYEAAKGKANGTGLISTIPFRPARLQLPNTWTANPRILHSVVSFGQSHIQVIVLYCKPLSNSEAIDFNNQLMRLAYDQSLHLPLPLIIMGDLNMPVVDFEIWPELESKGFEHLFSLYHKKYGCNMPPSCKEVTNPDTAIISPSLLPHLHDITVLESTWFATHRPVTFSLIPPEKGLFRQLLRYPKQLIHVGIDDLREAATDSLSWRCKPTTIEEVGYMIEEVADHALYIQSKENTMTAKNPTRLPFAYRGRCQPIQPKKTPVHAAIRRARHGDFEPSCEVLTMKTTQKVKQLRRLQSFQIRLKKFEQGIFKPTTFEELKIEWKVICKSHAFESIPFLHWVQQHPELGPPSWPLPSYPWIFDLSQIVHFQVEAALKADARWVHKKLIYARRIDATGDGFSKQAFRCVRGPGFPPITEIQHSIKRDFLVAPLAEPGHFELYGEKIDEFHSDFPILIDGEIFKICDQNMYCMQVCNTCILELPEQVEAHQTTFAHSPQQIAHSLNQFWNPIWQRDDTNIDDVFMHANFQEITSTFPPHPAYQIDFGLSFWQDAVKKLKSHSARGIDMISAQELKFLSDDMLQDIANVLTSYHHGFPEWFMIGLTCPLAKTQDIPSNGQTRPITIMAQLYRLWSAVSSRHLLRVLSEWAPPSITGLLPKRGAFDNAYQMQLELELAKARHHTRSGLTLDLKKCFNCIRWTFAFAMLRAIGIPLNILKQWFISLTRLCRYWVISGEVWIAGSTTCGFPEGDTFSVVTMIAVSCAWIFFVSRRPSLNNQLALSAYADNWGWRVNDIQTRSIILRDTLQLLDSAGLTIDWSKTWFWTTCNSEADTLASLLTPIANNQVVRKHAAGDLGLQLHYSGQRVRGLAKTRIDNGLKRLARLQSMQQDLSVKEHMLRSSVYPAMFHGCELIMPSHDELTRIRTKVQNSLIGKAYSASPAITLALTNKVILDPEFWIWLKVLLTAKKYLHKSDDETRYWFFRIASSFRGTLQATRGPASVFGFVIHQLSWNIDSNGMLSLATFLKFPILKISHKRLIRFAMQAWMQSLLVMHTQRSKLFGFPDINRYDTVAILAKFSCEERKKLLREISGAVQLPTQKQHWCTEHTLECPFCSMEDSKTHRLLECPIGNDIREEFSDTISEINSSGSLLPEFTVLHVHPDSEALDLAQFQHSHGIINATVQKMVVSFQKKSLPINWYTDGSCQYPHLVTSRFAAYSVVFDACQSDSERRSLARFARHQDVTPPTFLTACANRVFGEQDILRAELLAIETILRHFGVGRIHTDSATAIHFFHRFFQAESLQQLSDLEHFDIFSRLWPLRDDMTVSFVKVKAHTDLDTPDDLELYSLLGNQYADKIAVETCLKLQPELVTLLKKRAENTLQERERLVQVFRLQLKLAEKRSQALKQQAVAEQGTRACAQPEIVQAFSQWDVDNPTVFHGQYNIVELQVCAWGHENANRTIRWLRQFRWPDNPLGPTGRQTGICWPELALSWMLFNQCYLPLRRKDQWGQERLMQPGSFFQAKEMGANLSEFGSNCQHLLEHVQSLVVQSITPKLTTGKCNSCYIQGFQKFYQGIKVRPAIPCQKEVVELLQSILSKGPSKFLDVVPEIFFNAGQSNLPRYME